MLGVLNGTRLIYHFSLLVNSIHVLILSRTFDMVIAFNVDHVFRTVESVRDWLKLYFLKHFMVVLTLSDNSVLETPFTLVKFPVEVVESDHHCSDIVTTSPHGISLEN